MQYVRASQIAQDKGVSVSTIWRMVKAHKLPQGRKLSNRITVFNADEVDAAFEKLMSE